MSKVVFILIDGIRCDTAFRNMGFLEHLKEAGVAARYKIQSELPSISRPLYETLMTGVNTITHGIYSNEIKRLSTEQHVFGLAKENNLKTAAAAYSWFSELYNKVPFNPLTDRIQNDDEMAIMHGIYCFDETGAFYPDGHLVADANMLLYTYKPDFMLVHTMNMDDIGHRFGGDSKEYANTAVKTDYILSNVIPLWMNEGYDIVITADHGMNEWAMHGGNSDIERLVPLYIISDKVDSGDYSQEILSQLIIAPLLCHLLEIPKGDKMVEPNLPGLKG